MSCIKRCFYLSLQFTYNEKRARNDSIIEFFSSFHCKSNDIRKYLLLTQAEISRRKSSRFLISNHITIESSQFLPNLNNHNNKTWVYWKFCAINTQLECHLFHWVVCGSTSANQFIYARSKLHTIFSVNSTACVRWMNCIAMRIGIEQNNNNNNNCVLI